MHRDKAAKIGRRKRNVQLITIGIIAAVAIAIGIAAYTYMQNPPRTTSFGAVGSAHEHAALKVYIHGKPVDFSQAKYQIRSNYIHFESNNGDIVHRHATLVDMGYLFETLRMKLTNDCFTTDDGTAYCNDGTNTLKFYVNNLPKGALNNHVLRDGDRILISYGSEDSAQISEQLKTLNEIEIGT